MSAYSRIARRAVSVLATLSLLLSLVPSPAPAEAAAELGDDAIETVVEEDSTHNADHDAIEESDGEGIKAVPGDEAEGPIEVAPAGESVGVVPDGGQGGVELVAQSADAPQARGETVSLGGYHSAAIRSDGSLCMWGRNGSGQLGDSATEDRTSPVKVMDGVAAVSLGGTHSAAIKEDSSLWVWGSNTYHQLGEFSTTPSMTSPVKAMDGVVAVSLGEIHSAAIKEDGSLWTWGENSYGRLGDGTTEYRPTPVKVMDGVAAVSLGGTHSAAIKEDGSLWMWGHNHRGQLGDDTTEDRHYPVKVMDGVAAVSLGGSHSAAIKEDGSLWMWGYNYQGQLGKGTTEDRHYPVKVMDGVAAVSLGGYHSAAIKEDGSLWTWGTNYGGELGDGTTENRNSPVRVMDGVAAVSLGEYYSAAIKEDGSLWTWGYNKYGQLGDSTTENRTSPVKVMDGAAMSGGESSGFLPSRDALNIPMNYGTSGWCHGRANEYPRTLFERVLSSSRQADWIEWYENVKANGRKGQCHGYCLVAALSYLGICPSSGWRASLTEEAREELLTEGDEDDGGIGKALRAGRLADVPLTALANDCIWCDPLDLNLMDYAMAAQIAQYLPVAQKTEEWKPDELLELSRRSIEQNKPIIISLHWPYKTNLIGGVTEYAGHTLIPYAIEETSEGVDLLVYDCNKGPRTSNKISFLWDRSGELQWEFEFDRTSTASSSKWWTTARVIDREIMSAEWDAICGNPSDSTERLLVVSGTSSIARDGETLVSGEIHDNALSKSLGVHPIMETGNTSEGATDGGSSEDDTALFWVDEIPNSRIAVVGNGGEAQSRVAYVRNDLSIDVSSSGETTYECHETDSAVTVDVTPTGDSPIAARIESDDMRAIAVSAKTSGDAIEVVGGKTSVAIAGASEFTLSAGGANSRPVTYKGLDEEDVYTVITDGSSIGVTNQGGESVQPTFSIGDAIVTVPAQRYTGRPLEPRVSVSFGGTPLSKGKDYVVSYADNTNAGTATAIVKGVGRYTDTKTVTFEISKAKNPMTTSARSSKVSVTYDASADQATGPNVTVSKAVGNVTYANTSDDATAKGFAVNARTGAVTVPRGTGAGTYAVRVRVSTAGDANHEASSKVVSYDVTVAKAKQPLKARAKRKSVRAKHSKVKKKKVTLSSNVKITKKGKGKVTYKKASVKASKATKTDKKEAKKAAKKFKVNAKNGKLTIPKGTPKGTYSVKVKVSAAGDASHKAGSATVSYKVVIK